MGSSKKDKNNGTEIPPELANMLESEAAAMADTEPSAAPSPAKPMEEYVSVPPPKAPLNGEPTTDGSALPSTPPYTPQPSGGATGVTGAGAESAAGVVSPPGPGPVNAEPDKETRVTGGQLPEARRKDLQDKISRLYNDAVRYLGTRKDLAESAMEQLKEARASLDTAPAEAEYKVFWAAALIKRAQSSRSFSSRLVSFLVFLYQLVWLAIFGVGFLETLYFQDFIAKHLVGSTTGALSVLVYADFWASIMWGGIGGLIGAMYHLWWHVSKLEDFDKSYTMWYVVQPVMGAVLGGLMYLIMAAGLLAMNIVPQEKDVIHALPLVLAAIAGFRQVYVYELLDRLVKSFMPSPEEGTQGTPQLGESESMQ